MISYFNNKVDAVQFADDLRTAFPNASPSITIISPEKFAVSYVTTTIGISSDDSEGEQVATFFSQTQVNT